MKQIVFPFIISLLLLLSSSSFADDDYVVFAKSLVAHDFDSSLPSVPVEQWLRSSLPQGVTATWGKSVTDCGEQTGDPAIDRSRDMPLCVEIELAQNEEPVGYLMLFVATQKKGKLKEQAGLYFGSLKLHDKTVWLKKLGDLANIK